MCFSRLLVLLVLTVASPFASAKVNDPEFLEYLLSLNSGMDVSKAADVDGIKESLLRKKGISFGIQGGKYWAMGELEQYIGTKADNLALSFDFRKIVIPYQGYLVLPPVIDQLDSKTVYRPNGRQIRSAEQVYDIRSNPRFVTAIPTWKDYVSFTRQKPVIRYSNYLPDPDNPREIEIWRKAVREGWLQGMNLAVRAINLQFALLAADYQGMIRYHLMRDREMVSELQVDSTFYEVIGGGASMSVNDVVITISANPILNSNRFQWKAIPQLPEIKELFPKGVMFREFGRGEAEGASRDWK